MKDLMGTFSMSALGNQIIFIAPCTPQTEKDVTLWMQYTNEEFMLEYRVDGTFIMHIQDDTFYMRFDPFRGINHIQLQPTHIQFFVTVDGFGYEFDKIPLNTLKALIQAD